MIFGFYMLSRNSINRLCVHMYTLYHLAISSYRKEFREHFVRLGFDKKSVIDALFRYADLDESDEVSFHEYVTLSLVLLVLRILYAFADFDKSGQLSKEEVRKVLDEAHIPEDSRKKFDHQFSVVDVDDSKSLTYQEFVMLVLLMFHDD